jgi:phage shock protein A
MTSDQMTAKIRAAGRPAERRAARELARRALWRFAPAYASRRSRRNALALSVARLEADLEQLRKRHTEQIERLEDLVRELVLTAETLRRGIPEPERRDEV